MKLTRVEESRGRRVGMEGTARFARRNFRFLLLGCFSPGINPSLRPRHENVFSRLRIVFWRGRVRDPAIARIILPRHFRLGSLVDFGRNPETFKR